MKISIAVLPLLLLLPSLGVANELQVASGLMYSPKGSVHLQAHGEENTT